MKTWILDKPVYGILAQAMARYFLERYSGSDRNEMLVFHKDGYAIAVKEEAAEKMAKLLLDQEINKHQSTSGYDGPSFKYRDNAYCFDGYSYHGAWKSHIKEFIRNEDGTVTIDYNVYYFHEDDAFNRYHWLSDKTFAIRVNENPAFFDPPVAACKITVKRIEDNFGERYVIIRNEKNNAYL